MMFANVPIPLYIHRLIYAPGYNFCSKLIYCSKISQNSCAYDFHYTKCPTIWEHIDSWLDSIVSIKENKYE